MILTAKLIAALTAAYLLTGLAVGLAYLIFRIEQDDAGARGAYAFRPLLLPGLSLLWPLVLLRWVRPPSSKPDPVTTTRHKQAHRLIWSAMAVLLVVVLGLAFSLKRVPLPDQPSLRLSLGAGGLA